MTPRSNSTPPLILQALLGQPTSRRPLWVMRQAGRYLPEYRELRARYTFEQLCAAPEAAAEATLQPMRRFPLDAAIVFADLMSPLSALGVAVRFDPGPVVDAPVRDRDDVARLTRVTREIAPEVLETLARVRSTLEAGAVEGAARPALLGFAGGPWSIAAYLVEGRGTRGFPLLRARAQADPQFMESLLDVLASLAADYGRAQADAGAEALQLFETWSGLLSRADWRRLVKPRLAVILQAWAEHGIPRILFLQDAPHLVEEALDLPVDAISVDWRLDLAALRTRAGDGLTLQGNLDPAFLLAGPEVTKRAALALLDRVPAHRHIANLGHGILPETPIESMHALVQAVHEHAGASVPEEPLAKKG